MHILGTRITSRDPSGFRAGVPVVGRAVVLNPRVGPIPRSLCYLPEQLLRLDGLLHLAAAAGGKAERAAVLDRTHELVADPHRVVRVLVLDADDVLAAEVHVEARVAQDPDLLLLAGLGDDEIL